MRSFILFLSRADKNFNSAMVVVAGGCVLRVRNLRPLPDAEGSCQCLHFFFRWLVCSECENWPGVTVTVIGTHNSNKTSDMWCGDHRIW